jgi:hypothetical protein
MRTPAGAGILRFVEVPLGFGGAIRVGRGLDSGNGGRNVFAVGGKHDGAEAGDGDGVAGMNDAALLAFDGLEVGGVVVAGNVGVFAVLSVVEELADRDAGHQIGHAADVIHVEVGDEQVIDACDAGVLHGCLDAVGVAAIVAGPAGVDEQGFAGGGDQQSGLAAFDIDGVDEEMLRRFSFAGQCIAWVAD